MCGEEKEDEDDFEDAWADNERKLGAGFPLFSYPNIDAIFCYAAAHKLLQYALQPVAGGKPIRIKSAYNLDLAEQRVYALLAAVNIFRFFRPFVERAPLDARKRFDPSKIIPHGFSKLHFATSSKGWEVVKRIDFAENYFGGDVHSRFDTLQAVYDLIGECDAARSAIGQPRLIQKRLRSGSSRRNYIYEVRLHPVGCDTDIAEWDLSMLKAAMKAFFLCFAVMHKGGFVHTDPRWQNLIWMARLCPRVIDFESAQKLGYEVTHRHHELWDNGTLNSKGCYTSRSDLYQVGKILAIWAEKHPSELIPSGMDLQRRLEAKTIKLEQALSHNFLVG